MAKIQVFFTHCFEAVTVWRCRRRERRMLQTLPDWALKDIGLTRGDVYHEASKPFWRA